MSSAGWRTERSGEYLDALATLDEGVRLSTDPCFHLDVQARSSIVITMDGDTIISFAHQARSPHEAKEAMNARTNGDTGRPEFMTTLGLLPPYTLEDVKSAYRVKALQTHPDRGGETADFLKVHEAYERAKEYVEFSGDRRKWIAGQVECYLRQQEAAGEVWRLGGQVEFEEIEWLKRSVGDFSVLADRLRVIRLRNTAADDAFLTFLAERPSRAPYLVKIDLAGTRITDMGLQALTRLGLLRRLDLSGTKVTKRGVRSLMETLPSLQRVALAGTAIGWLSRWRLRALLRQRRGKNERLGSLAKRLEQMEENRPI